MNATAWDVLDLAETADPRSIKRAYAKALKTTRPDEDAGKFQMLTEAYEWAMGYARHQARLATAAEQDGATEESPQEAVQDTTTTVADPAPADGVDATSEASDEAAASDSAAKDEGFHFAPFFDGMVEQIRHPNPLQLKQWLEQHPDLYNIELKWALIPHVFDTLAHNAQAINPHRGHLDALQTFFGVDATLRRHPAVAPALDYLEAGSWKAEQQAQATQQPAPMPAGWENLNEVMHTTRKPASRRPDGGGFSGWWIFGLLMVLKAIAAAVSSA